MKQLYQKSRLGFALAWIGIYVVLLSLADGLSESLGARKIITAPLCIAMGAFIFVWLRRNGLAARYGLCRFRGRARAYLYFLLLAALCSTNLWFGVKMNFSPAESALYVLSMLCVGFLEEVIFRGFLFRALEADNLKRAIIISSVTFGMGHIVNLLNGAELLPTLLQICYASAIGLLFTVIFLRSGCLLPCIAAHSIVNSLSAFSAEPKGGPGQLVSAVFIIVLSLAYAAWIWKKTGTAD